MNTKHVKVGVACFIFKHGTFLMGQRKGAHGAGSWSVPGGHLEFGETFADTAAREVFEETGLTIQNIRFGALTNDYFAEEDKHYVTIWMVSDYAGGKAQIMEPDKYVNQQWFSFDKLPTPLFLPWNQLLESEYIGDLQQAALKTQQ